MKHRLITCLSIAVLLLNTVVSSYVYCECSHSLTALPICCQSGSSSTSILLNHNHSASPPACPFCQTSIPTENASRNSHQSQPCNSCCITFDSAFIHHSSSVNWDHLTTTWLSLPVREDVFYSATNQLTRLVTTSPHLPQGPRLLALYCVWLK